VDDEPLVARSIARALAPEHAVCVAETAEEACASLVAGDRYDAVICDLTLPGMSGTELHAWVAGRDPALAARFVFVTGALFSEEERARLEGAVAACVEKPFDLRRLREVVRRAAGGAGGVAA